MKKKFFDLSHLKISGKKYAGKYIAVVDGKIVASGTNMKVVYKKAASDIPSTKEIGLFYIPLKEELLTALWNIVILI